MHEVFKRQVYFDLKYGNRGVKRLSKYARLINSKPKEILAWQLPFSGLLWQKGVLRGSVYSFPGLGRGIRRASFQSWRTVPVTQIWLKYPVKGYCFSLVEGNNFHESLSVPVTDRDLILQGQCDCDQTVILKRKQLISWHLWISRSHQSTGPSGFPRSTWNSSFIKRFICSYQNCASRLPLCDITGWSVLGDFPVHNCGYMEVHFVYTMGINPFHWVHP